MESLKILSWLIPLCESLSFHLDYLQRALSDEGKREGEGRVEERRKRGGGERLNAV